jgi:hypothetical protein
LIYQHATSERDREIAEAMDERIAKQQGKKATPARPRRRGSKRGDDPGEADGMARVG